MQGTIPITLILNSNPCMRGEKKESHLNLNSTIDNDIF